MGTINSKILLAFLGGAVLASGIVYMAVKPAPPVQPPIATKPVYVNPPDPVVPEQTVSPVVSAEAVPPVRELPADHVADHSKAPVKLDKHSPSSPARKTEIAQVVEPPAAAIAELPRPASNDLPEPPPSAPPPPPDPMPSEPLPPPVRQPHTVTLTPGTLLAVRIGETLTADHNQVGDTFLATLDQPVVVDGFVIAERGARLEGRVVEADRGGRVKGVSHLGVELVKLATADGQHVRIRTSPFAKQAQASTGSDAAKVGIGAAIGAAIGGLAGGGKGAGVGAGVGGAAGAGDVLLTRGKPASIPVETRVSFRLQDPVTITEHLR